MSTNAGDPPYWLNYNLWNVQKEVSTYIPTEEEKLWANIRKAAKTNSSLNEMLEQVKSFYFLSKNG